jgi:predicted nucleic-acid-binding protein
MRAIDTNVLVRLFTRDDEAQTAAAETFVSQGAWVSLLAVAETIWVLDTVYDLSPSAQARTIEMMLNHRDLVLQDREIIASALERFRSKPALGFSDCLMLEIARKAGHLPLGTFDRRLGGLNGAERL